MHIVGMHQLPKIGKHAQFDHQFHHKLFNLKLNWTLLLVYGINMMHRLPMVVRSILDCMYTQFSTWIKRVHMMWRLGLQLGKNSKHGGYYNLLSQIMQLYAYKMCGLSRHTTITVLHDVMGKIHKKYNKNSIPLSMLHYGLDTLVFSIASLDDTNFYV